MLIDLFPEYKQQMQEICKARYPEEAVILITEKNGMYEVNNISKDPENSFSISKKDTLEAFDDGLLAVIHSHPDYHPVPSEADMVYQRQCAVPFGIIGVSKERVTEVIYFGDQVKYDLLKRPFVHGKCDCYSLIKDFYKEKLNIDLPEFPRDWAWWESGQELYKENLLPTGFVEVDVPQYGDMFLACIGSKTPNHAGVYLGNELILHHISSGVPVDTTRLPAQIPINPWVKRIDSFWRFV